MLGSWSAWKIVCPSQAVICGAATPGGGGHGSPLTGEMGATRLDSFGSRTFSRRVLRVWSFKQAPLMGDTAPYQCLPMNGTWQGPQRDQVPETLWVRESHSRYMLKAFTPWALESCCSVRLGMYLVGVGTPFFDGFNRQLKGEPANWRGGGLTSCKRAQPLPLAWMLP